VVADDRSRRVSDVPAPASAPRADTGEQTACFVVGSLRLELSAAPGAARLVVADDRSRDIYVVEPNALAIWAAATARLMMLMPALQQSDRVEYRTPYLIDREGRASIAFEGLVSEQTVSYRLLVSGAESKVAGLMTTGEIVRQVSEAAAGAVAVARVAVRP
jgi:hypothetical protein